LQFIHYLVWTTVCLALRERVDIAVSLVAGLDHGGVPAGGAAAGARRIKQWIGGGKKQSFFNDGIGALLGFEDERAAFVEIDSAGGVGSVTGEGR